MKHEMRKIDVIKVKVKQNVKTKNKKVINWTKIKNTLTWTQVFETDLDIKGIFFHV